MHQGCGQGSNCQASPLSEGGHNSLSYMHTVDMMLASNQPGLHLAYKCMLAPAELPVAFV